MSCGRRQGSATNHYRRDVVRRASDGDRSGHEASDRMNVRDEKGQALILALAFLMFSGLVVGVLLSLASSSVLSSSQLREQRSSAYAADGATDAAIQVALKNIGIGAYGDPRCLSSSPTTVGSTFLLTTTTLTT